VDTLEITTDNSCRIHDIYQYFFHKKKKKKKCMMYTPEGLNLYAVQIFALAYNIFPFLVSKRTLMVIVK
jgi:hypothetical protein